MKTVRNNKTKGFSPAPIWIFTLASLAVLALGFGVYAWFTGDIRTVGTGVSTGKIDITFRTYKYYESAATGEDGSTGTLRGLRRYIDKSVVNPSSVELENAMQSNVGILGDGDTDDIYLVVSKNPDSVPLDIQYLFSLAGVETAENTGDEELLAYAGGFVYRLKDVTAAVEQTPADTSAAVYTVQGSSISTSESDELEQKLWAYITESKKGTDGYTNDSSPHLLTEIGEITSDNRALTLRTGDYCVYRLSVSLNPDAEDSVQYQGCSFGLEIRLMVAQEDGLESYGNSRTYHVSGEAELNSILSVYKPGDSIVLDGDIDYYGDLNISRPLNLYLNYNGGARLSVHGNLIFTYPYDDSFVINTEGGGQLNVLKNGNSGGNFSIDTPMCVFTLTGDGNDEEGKADINVQGKITVNCSCAPAGEYDSTDYSYGLIVNRSRICLAGGVQGENAPLNRIYLMNDTQLTVCYNTEIGRVQAFTDFDESGKTRKSVKRLTIVNYGTVAEQLVLSDMLEDTDGQYSSTARCPQIFIRNYGTFSKQTVLPTWSEKFTGTSGNTRAIIELGASDIPLAAGSVFTEEDIERVSISANVVDISDAQNHSSLLVHYIDLDENDGISPSLNQLLSDYFAVEHCTYSDVLSLRVITYGEQVLTWTNTAGDTETDYAVIREFTNLQELDLSGAVSMSDTVPAGAFRDMGSLMNLSLPDTATTLQNGIVAGTQVTDLYLPATVTSVTDTSLDGVTGVHILNETTVIANLRKGTGGSGRYIFVSSLILSEYKAHGNYKSYLAYIHAEATLDREKDIYYRIVSDTDIEIACYTGESVTGNGGQFLKGFDYSEYRISGSDKDYAIVSFDDYAFVGKIDGESTVVDLYFSDRLVSVGAYAFQNCTGIGSLHFEADSTGNTQRVLGNYSFDGCSNIGGALVLSGVNELGNGTFKNCDKIVSVTATELTAAGSYIFYSCDSLEKAYCPSLCEITVPNNSFYGFACCPKLAVAETGWLWNSFGQVSYMFTDSYNLRLWLVHTETGNTFPSCNRYIHLSASDSTLFLTSSVLVDSGEIQSGVTNYGRFKSNLGYANNCITVNTGVYTADSYLFAVDSRYDGTSSGTVVTRRNYGTDESPVYLSDLGYGDYIYVIDSDGNAEILLCTLESVSGDYSVPSEINDSTGTHPVVRLGHNAYRQVEFSGTHLSFPDSLKTVDSECFYDKDGIISSIASPLNLNCIETIGDKVFYDCDGIEAVKAPALTTAGGYIFWSCDSLLRAICPKLRNITVTTDFYGFACCPKLAVLETSVLYNQNGYLGRMLMESKNVKLWIVHTSADTNYSYQYQYIHLDTKVTTEVQSLGVLIDSITESNGKNHYSQASGRVGWCYNTQVCDTGTFTADTFRYSREDRYGTGSGTTVARREYEYGSSVLTLSGLGYGDYVYAVDSDGNATILYCTLESISGNYTVPASITDADGIHPVVAVSHNAYRQVEFVNTHLSFPDSLVSLGAYSFYDRDGIISSLDSPLNLNCIETIGDRVFYDCDNIVSVSGISLEKAGSHIFYSCDSLAVVYFPNLEKLSCDLNFYGFAYCPKLAVVETGVMESSNSSVYYMLKESLNTKLWLVHTEGNTEIPSCNNYIHLYTQNTSAIASVSVLIDGNITDSGKVKYNVFAERVGYAYNTIVCNTGAYTADKYLFADESRYSSGSTVVTRRNYGTEDSPVYLSDLGYGDYIYALDELGNATILCCTLEKITGNYQVPASLNGHPVTAVGHSAYRNVVFEGGATLTLPEGIISVGEMAFSTVSTMACTSKDFLCVKLPESLESLESQCFGGCLALKAIHILNRESAVSATNIISTEKNYVPSNGITVYVNTYAYINLYTSDRWGNLPRSCFARSDIAYMPEDGGPTFYLTALEGGGYELTYISGAGGETLNIPSAYTPEEDSGYGAGNITYIAPGAFSALKSLTTLKTMTLPDMLQSFTVERSDIPTCLEAYVISASNQYFLTDSGVLFSKDKSVLVSVPGSFAGNSGVFEIPSSVRVISENALLGCLKLTEISISGNPVFISTGAVKNCTALTVIRIKSGSSVIFSGSAVAGCSSLSDVVCEAGSGCIFAGSETFSGCRGDFKITVTENLYGSLIAGVCLDRSILSLLSVSD